MRVLTYLLVASLAAAQQQGSQQSAQRTAQQQALCTIEGVVRQADTGEPLKKALLTAFASTPRGNGPMNPVTASTDAEGKFRLTNIEPGQYRLVAERSGYVRMEHGARKPNQPGTPLTLKSGDELKNVELKLVRHAVVTGRITDEDGDPVQGAQVQLMRYTFVRGRRQLMPVSGGSSNDLGEYRLFGIAPGKYYLSVSHRAGGPFGAMMMRGGGRGGPGGVMPPSADQNYAPMYFPGTFELDSATLLEIPVGSDMRGVDMRLLRTRTYRVSGRVVAQSEGRRGGMVMLVPKSSAGFGFGDRMAAPWRPNTGTFEIQGVRPGSYNLVVQSFDGQNRMSARVPVEVGEGDVTDVTISPVPGSDLSGVVRVQDKASIDLQSLRVQLSPREMGPFGGFGTSPVQADGKFIVNNLTAGQYDISITGLSENTYVKAVRYGEADALATGVDLSGGSAGLLDVVISPNGAAVSGSVADNDGNPKSGATVLLVPTADRHQRLDLYKTANSDQSGAFRFTGVAPGDYLLFALEDHERGAEYDPKYVEQFSSSAEKLSMREAATETKALKLLAPPN
jgi:hypothetical protein